MGQHYIRFQERSEHRYEVAFLLLLLSVPCGESSGNDTFMDKYLLEGTPLDLRLYTSRSVVHQGDRARFVCMALLADEDVSFQWLVDQEEVPSRALYEVVEDSNRNVILVKSRNYKMRYSALRVKVASLGSHTVSCRVTTRKETRTVYQLSSAFEVQSHRKPDGTPNDNFPGHSNIGSLCGHSAHCVGQDVNCMFGLQDLPRCECAATTHLNDILEQCIREHDFDGFCYFKTQCSSFSLKCDKEKNRCICQDGYENASSQCITHVVRDEFCDNFRICVEPAICVDKVCSCAPGFHSYGSGCRKRGLNRASFVLRTVVIACSFVFIVVLCCMGEYFRLNRYKPTVLYPPEQRVPGSASQMSLRSSACDISCRESLHSRARSLTSKFPSRYKRRWRQAFTMMLIHKSVNAPSM
ncbi:uncharacterized protein LOC135371262 [Ornithodoros turicata]|uniref:uncharacterized protein LOC135371262 n=1 Tax=Ornithodoros turicata TaxID=34597 RepID=UPI003139C078